VGFRPSKKNYFSLIFWEKKRAGGKKMAETSIRIDLTSQYDSNSDETPGNAWFIDVPPAKWWTDTPADYSHLGKDIICVLVRWLPRNAALRIRRVCKGWKYGVDESISFWRTFGFSTRDGLSLSQSVIYFCAQIWWEHLMHDLSVMRMEKARMKTKLKNREERIEFLNQEVQLFKRNIQHSDTDIDIVSQEISSIKKEFGFKKQRVQKDLL